MSTSYKRLSFTNEEEEVLIEYIKCHPALWDASHVEYGNGELRKLYWLTIAAELNKSVLECRRKWRFIRDYYIHKRRRLNDSTSQRDGKYFSLHFLDKVSVRRLASTQKPSVASQLRQESKNGLCGSTVRIQKLEPDFEDSELEYTLTPDVAFEKVTMERMERSQNYMLDDDDQDQYTNDEPSPDLVSNDDFHYDESSMVHDSAEEQKFEENEEEHLVETNVEPELEQANKATDILKHERAIDLFFESMAAAVKTFPPYFVAEAKLRVFSAINELEMKVHSSGVRK